MTRINPLVLAIEESKPITFEEDDDGCLLPDTVQALLLAHCDPNDVGVTELSPLCEAIRSGDCRAITQLLTFRANPNRGEQGSNVPSSRSLVSVPWTMRYRNPRAREAAPTPTAFDEDVALLVGKRHWRRRRLTFPASVKSC